LSSIERWKTHGPLQLKGMAAKLDEQKLEASHNKALHVVSLASQLTNKELVKSTILVRYFLRKTLFHGS
jgi:hypothetical protein